MAVRAMEPHGLLAGTTQPVPCRHHRFSLDHDGAFIFKICDNGAKALFQRLAPWAARLRHSPLRWAPLLVSLAGLLPLAHTVITPEGALYQPLAAMTYLGVAAALVLTTAVHEFAHGLTLTSLRPYPPSIRDHCFSTSHPRPSATSQMPGYCDAMSALP